MSETNVELFILSRNRLEYLPEAVESALKQDYPHLRVVISDNSTDDRVANHLRNAHPALEIRRRSGLTAYEHLNLVFSEITCELFMIFHDDDVLEPSAVSELAGALKRHPNASCAAGNARLIYGQKPTNELFNPSLNHDLELKNPADLIERYFDFSLGVNPFPGYLYRRSVVGDLRFDIREGGQYTDLTFLARLCARGPVEWLAKPLMKYRKHGLNHSATASLMSAKSTIRFLEKQGYLKPGAEITRQFRYWNHFFFMKNSKAKKYVFRRRQKALVAAYFLMNPRSFVRRSWQKLAAKLAR